MVWKNVRLGLALSLALSGGVGGMALMPPIAIAAQSTVSGLELTPNGERLQLAIALQGSGQPQVFFSQQGNAWVGDITNAQLQLAPGQSALRQDNPVPGVNYIEARQLDANSVRVRIEGAAGPLEGLLAQRSPDQLVFDFSAPILSDQAPSVAAAPATSAANTGVWGAAPGTPSASSQPPLTDITQLRNTSSNALPESSPPTDVVAQAPAVAVPPPPAHMTTVPRQATGAVPPPTGDIAVGNIDLAPRPVDLGSQEPVSLTLKDAPVGDVLALLVRRAGLNVVLNDVATTDTISLDVQDSPLQDVFNSVLRLNQLQGERVGRTVFIGATLPGVQETNMQTFRLNQSVVADVVGVLDALSAEGAPLAGMQFVPDERTNSIMAVGTPNQMAIASAQIAQLDVRQRQALIHVKLITVTLNNGETLAARLGGSSGNFATSGVDGSGIAFEGDRFPSDTTEFDAGFQDVFGAAPSGSLFGPGGGGTTGDSFTSNIGPFNATVPTLLFNTQNRLQNALGLRLEAVLTNASTNILADPRVIVSDGGSSKLEIGQEVITNRSQSVDPATGQSVVTFEKGNAGVNVDIQNVRIDDNGYVTLDITPQVSSPARVVTLPDGEITLLSQRTLTTERIRLRDGQTLILSGLIREEDTVNVSKIPILGDIPILGALFRSTSTNTERDEALLMVTPSILNDDAYLQPVSAAP